MYLLYRSHRPYKDGIWLMPQGAMAQGPRLMAQGSGPWARASGLGPATPPLLMSGFSLHPHIQVLAATVC